jgi:hypothetical protein
MRNGVNFLPGYQEFVKNTKLPFETGRGLLSRNREGPGFENKAKRLKFTDLVDKLLNILKTFYGECCY